MVDLEQVCDIREVLPPDDLKRSGSGTAAADWVTVLGRLHHLPPIDY
jgi:hypothetical protein